MVECRFGRILGYIHQTFTCSHLRQSTILDGYDWLQKQYNFISIDISEKLQSVSCNEQRIYVRKDFKSSRERRCSNLSFYVGISTSSGNTTVDRHWKLHHLHLSRPQCYSSCFNIQYHDPHVKMETFKKT